MLTFTFKIKKKWGSKESQMLVTMVHTIIPNQVVTTPRLSGGGQALQSLYDYLSHADKGKAGGGQGLQSLYDYLSHADKGINHPALYPTH